MPFGLVAAVALSAPHDAIAADERRLSFYHTHTYERLDIVFFKDGRYVASALEEVNRFLADFRTGDVAVIDPKLLDLIYEIRESVGSQGAYMVISAYRSPTTNNMLRSRGGLRKSGFRAYRYRACQTLVTMPMSDFVTSESRR